MSFQIQNSQFLHTSIHQLEMSSSIRISDVHFLYDIIHDIYAALNQLFQEIYLLLISIQCHVNNRHPTSLVHINKVLQCFNLRVFGLSSTMNFSSALITLTFVTWLWYHVNYMDLLQMHIQILWCRYNWCLLYEQSSIFDLE